MKVQLSICDPLSPLFILAAEGLSSLLSNACAALNFSTISIGTHLDFDLLQFADDTIIMGNAYWSNIWAIK